eukprot:CAMPEP_0175665566 /NCGR_PEP_ID=MMETSP0097-20121207/17127_1 /TAXON_ID=311494 /ORGANISM="Alexandrium monilatum, Strain CCMP3105" /LENGTH=318 /DNA_ID=CAMNT_0016971947 /DNA_START=55 /DNA_END=1008 /DNA_ORIENTATION=-
MTRSGRKAKPVSWWGSCSGTSLDEPPTDIFWEVVPRFVTDPEVARRFIRFLTKCWTQAFAASRGLCKADHADKAAVAAARAAFTKTWISDALYRLYQACDGRNMHLTEGDARRMFGAMCNHADCLPGPLSRGLDVPPQDWEVVVEIVERTFAELRESDHKMASKGAWRPAAADDTSGPPPWWRKSVWAEEDSPLQPTAGDRGAAAGAAFARLRAAPAATAGCTSGGIGAGAAPAAGGATTGGRTPKAAAAPEMASGGGAADAASGSAPGAASAAGREARPVTAAGPETPGTRPGGPMVARTATRTIGSAGAARGASAA